MKVKVDTGQLRLTLARSIAEAGHAPSNGALARLLDCDIAAVEEALRELALQKGLLLHPNKCRPWAVHPFALAPGSCWVETGARGYWANCLYCAFGIAACLGSDAMVFTRLGGESDHVEFRICNGRVDNEGLLFHLSVPVIEWWDNVIYACSSFQPFRHEADIDEWCTRHDLPKGAILSIPQLWGFAQSWYGGCLDHPWRQRTKAEVAAIFASHGLSGAFWEI
jgi:hypothetical protein